MISDAHPHSVFLFLMMPFLSTKSDNYVISIVTVKYFVLANTNNSHKIVTQNNIHKYKQIISKGWYKLINDAELNRDFLCMEVLDTLIEKFFSHFLSLL
jgi:hypothetical protein